MDLDKMAELARQMLLTAAWNKRADEATRDMLYSKSERMFELLLGMENLSAFAEYTTLIGLGQIRAKRDYDYDAAVDLYDKAIELPVRHPEVHMLRGHAETDAGRYASGIDSYEAAIALSDNPEMTAQLNKWITQARAKQARCGGAQA